MVAIKKPNKSGDVIEEHFRLIFLSDALQKVMESTIINKLYDKFEKECGPFAHFAIRKRGTHTAIAQY